MLEAAWLRWSGEWYLYALKFTQNDADADDAVSEALRRTLRADPSLSSAHHAKNYVRRAIRSVAAATHEKRKRRRVLLAEFRRSQPGEAKGPLELFVAGEESARIKNIVQGVLAAMNPELREAVELYYDPRKKMTFRDVAEAQGVSVRTSYKRVQAGLDLIARAIQDDRE